MSNRTKCILLGSVMPVRARQDMEYRETRGDEVEDLLALVAFAKARFPQIEAVASGAIASNYQVLERARATSGLTDRQRAPSPRQQVQASPCCARQRRRINGRRGAPSRASLKPVGCTSSYLACGIGHLVPVRPPCVGFSFQL
jgi:hypothetical protein